MTSHDPVDWRANAPERPWYVVTCRGDDLANFVSGRIRRPGKVIHSLSWRGAQLMADPADSRHYGYGLRFTPWTVWRVKPLAPLRAGSNPFYDYEPTKPPEHVWTRSFVVAEQMPAGFEYGPHGARAQATIEHLAGIDPFRDVDDAMLQDDYRRAYRAMERAVAAEDQIPLARHSLARAYFEKIASANEALGKQSPERWRRIHGPFEWHTGAIIDAALVGITIPAAVQEFWDMPRSIGGYGFQWENNAAGR
ncbi:hypothetical protein NJBCHELONAE_43080 [Mycobacteroides chelonae]|uniref:hypothetical protein n=1 Tax=Mycobacteroides chelonae TaxID=1774 RepID=UPI0021DCD6DB|nr:hypothetical protein [Mycobacteroides chelonae]GLE58997.1 hypothetical protein NJBCHELONAE_43080 [Mycobacteroides chelonae]